MSGLEAVGLAGSIANFIQLGIEIVNKGREIYNSSTGVSETNDRIKTSVTRLQWTCRRITRQRDEMRSSSDHHGQLVIEISIASEQASQDLVELLQSLKAKPGILSSAVKALESEWKARKIQDLLQKFERLKSDLQLALLSGFSEKQSEMSQSLRASVDNNTKILLESNTRLKALQGQTSNILRALEFAARTDADFEVDNTMKKELLNLHDRLKLEQHKEKVLELLCFDNFYKRYDMIHKKHKDTYNWIFDDVHESQHIGFREWLENGDGIYCILGKPGCGKSTLMKAIYQDPRTTSALKRWAGEGNQCFDAAFFFWSAGNDDQKSREGLLRSLLYEVYQKCPELIPTTIPVTTVGSNNVQLSILLELMENLKTAFAKGGTQIRFCFFIDGLDEYIGDLYELAEILHNISTFPNVKSCVASRDRVAVRSLSDARHLLELHNHTANDIRTYVSERLGQSPIFKRLCAEDCRYPGLIGKVVAKAEGVFIWARFVVRDILKNSSEGDTFEEVEQYVDGLPPELEELYWRILLAVPPKFRQASSKLLLVRLQKRSDLPVLVLSFALSTNASLQSAAEASITPMDEESLMNASESAELRIKASCLDFLQVNQSKLWRADEESWYSRRRAEFVHRTVFDFLRKDDAISMLQDRVDQDFHAGNVLRAAWLAHLKRFPNNSDRVATSTIGPWQWNAYHFNIPPVRFTDPD